MTWIYRRQPLTPLLPLLFCHCKWCWEVQYHKTWGGGAGLDAAGAGAAGSSEEDDDECHDDDDLDDDDDNGGDDEEQITCTDTKEVMASIRQTDEEHMFFVHPDSPKMSWVFLVYGNDGYDVIADHSLSLNEMIETLDPLIHTLEAQFHGV